jgi:putative ABC transport system permease protein
MLKGRNFHARDEDSRRGVAIVSDKLVNNMFRGDANAALGQEVVVYIGQNIYEFTVIGVYEYEMTVFNMTNAAERDISTQLYIPIATAKKLVGSPATATATSR